ncbi:unnamed protein product [Schistosoma haematobium]|nr:unnamed protein product [Schistosoma haematobium]
MALLSSVKDVWSCDICHKTRYFVHLLLKLSIPVIVPHKTVLGIINTLICIGQFQAVPLYVNELYRNQSSLVMIVRI